MEAWRDGSALTDEEDTTFFWEVGDDGWVTRSVELVGPDQRATTAAALHEVIRARDSRGLPAVQAYQARYGVLVDRPIDDWDFPHDEITVSDFDQHWIRARPRSETGSSPLRHVVYVLASTSRTDTRSAAESGDISG
jgi:hypothetical protein